MIIYFTIWTVSLNIRIRLEGMDSLSKAPKAASRSEGTLLRSHNIVQIVIEIFSKSEAYQNVIERNMEWIRMDGSLQGWNQHSKASDWIEAAGAGGGIWPTSLLSNHPHGHRKWPNSPPTHGDADRKTDDADRPIAAKWMKRDWLVDY